MTSALLSNACSAAMYPLRYCLCLAAGSEVEQFPCRQSPISQAKAQVQAEPDFPGRRHDQTACHRPQGRATTNPNSTALAPPPPPPPPPGLHLRATQLPATDPKAASHISLVPSCFSVTYPVRISKASEYYLQQSQCSCCMQVCIPLFPFPNPPLPSSPPWPLLHHGCTLSLVVPWCLAQARATPLAPRQWRQMLADAQRITPSQAHSGEAEREEDAQSRPDSGAESSGNSDGSSSTAVAARPDVVVLDVRNDYEWDAGHFQGANRPQEVWSLAQSSMGICVSVSVFCLAMLVGSEEA